MFFSTQSRSLLTLGIFALAFLPHSSFAAHPLDQEEVLERSKDECYTCDSITLMKFVRGDSFRAYRPCLEEKMHRELGAHSTWENAIAEGALGFSDAAAGYTASVLTEEENTEFGNLILAEMAHQEGALDQFGKPAPELNDGDRGLLNFYIDLAEGNIVNYMLDALARNRFRERHLPRVEDIAQAEGMTALMLMSGVPASESKKNMKPQQISTPEPEPFELADLRSEIIRECMIGEIEPLPKKFKKLRKLQERIKKLDLLKNVYAGEQAESSEDFLGERSSVLFRLWEAHVQENLQY